jgi:hypothetical protein
LQSELPARVEESKPGLLECHASNEGRGCLDEYILWHPQFLLVCADWFWVSKRRKAMPSGHACRSRSSGACLVTRSCPLVWAACCLGCTGYHYVRQASLFLRFHTLLVVLSDFRVACLMQAHLVTLNLTNSEVKLQRGPCEGVDGE